MDKLIDFKTFDNLKTALNDPEFRKTVRLLCVFGNNGSEVILVTTEDNVYCLGSNRSGCLGLGTYESAKKELILNRNLSGKSLVNIVYGWDHCIGITSDGICYSWGHNDFGRLGIGTNERTAIPQQIFELKNQFIVAIACGSQHTIGLTKNGKVYSWGRNSWGQLGLRHFKCRYFPNLIEIKSKVVMISCGRQHSLALTTAGQVYIWGLNDSGQLGLNIVRQLDRDRVYIGKPQILLNFPNCHSIKQVVCGPFYSLLLANNGSILSFGQNNVGQLGRGHIDNSPGPIRHPIPIDTGIKFKEIIANNQNDHSMAVSIDNQCYAWGQTKLYNILSPKCTPESMGLSLHEKYAKLAKNPITFKTIVISEDKQELKSQINEKQETNKTTDENRPQTSNGNVSHKQNSDTKIVINYNENNTDDNQFKGNVCFNDNKNSRLMSNDQNCNDLDKTKSTANDMSNIENESINSDDFQSCYTTVAKVTAVQKFQKLLTESFNNKETFDLTFEFGKQNIIYCHKTILRIRNEKFYENCLKYLFEVSKGKPSGSDKQLKQKITIKTYSYKAFKVFVKYLYGFEPDLDKQIVDEVLKLATIYNEPELIELCYQLIRKTEDTINAMNVCVCYEKAINNSLTDLELFCIEFVSKNWKTICKSDAFQALNYSLSERLMTEVFKRKGLNIN